MFPNILVLAFCNLVQENIYCETPVKYPLRPPSLESPIIIIIIIIIITVVVVVVSFLFLQVQACGEPFTFDDEV